MNDNQASYNRKPVPKSQKEISNGFIDPYDQNLGNPNHFKKMDIIETKMVK